MLEMGRVLGLAPSVYVRVDASMLAMTGGVKA